MAGTNNPYRYGSNAQDVVLTDSQSVPIQDTTGSQIDPATEQTLAALADALDSQSLDEMRVDLTQQTGPAVSTDLTDQQGRNLGKARLMNSANTLIDPATEATLTELSHALASTGATNQDSLLVDSNTALDASAATVSVQESTPLDVSAATVTTNATVQNNTDGALSGAALSGNGSVTVLSAGHPGAERLVGQVASTGSYDVVVDWENSAGTVIRSETLYSAVTGGSWTDINQQMKSPYATLSVVDASGASQTVDATAHVR